MAAHGMSQPPVAEVSAPVIITGDSDADSTLETIQVDCTYGMVTLNLDPAILLPNKRFYIKKMDRTSNPVKVVPYLGDTIDGETSVLIQGQYNAMNIVSDGLTEWLQE